MDSLRRESSSRRVVPLGRSILANCARRPAETLELGESRDENRTSVRGRVPVCPGVYLWLNGDGTVIYVGKAKSLRHRLSGYFAARTADPKMGRIRRNSNALVWEPISHELLALVREQELIDRFRPPYNVEGKPERRQPGYICLSRGAAPTIFFARTVSPRAEMAVGPIAGRGELREAVAALNYVFQLRDCSERVRLRFSDQLQLFDAGGSAGCLRYELSSCPGPCAGGCSRQSYGRNVERARRFLGGKDAAVLRELELEMVRTASDGRYERAAVLRDQLSRLTWTDRRIRQLSAARKKLHGVWEHPGFDHQRHWMILRDGFLLRCTEAPGGNAADPLRIADWGTATSPSTTGNSPSNLAVNWMLLLAGWARKNPRDGAFMRTDRRWLPARACKTVA